MPGDVSGVGFFSISGNTDIPSTVLSSVRRNDAVFWQASIFMSSKGVNMLTLARKVRPLSVVAVLMLVSAPFSSTVFAQSGPGGAGGGGGGSGGAGGAGGGAGGAAGGAAAGAAGAAGNAAGAAGGVGGSAGNAAGGAASGAGSAASGAVGTAGNAATGAVGATGNVTGALGNVAGALGTTGLGVSPGPKASAAHRKAVLARFAEEGAQEQRDVRRRCVDVLRYPAEYDLALVDLCRILRSTSRR